MSEPSGAADHPEAVAGLIGGRVRAWRSERGWTLDGLASRSQVSRRTLVAIEAGSSNPSVGVLLRLARAFDVGLAAMVAEAPPAAVQIHRSGECPVLWTGEHGGRGVLAGASELPDAVEHWDWWMQPRDRHASEPHTAGTREVLLVHEGELELLAGAVTAHLAPGDSAVLHGDQPHAYACAGDTAVHFTMTVLQPDSGGAHP